MLNILISEKSMKIKPILDKFHAGDPISDDELRFAVEFMGNLRGMLWQMGPEWAMPAKEANRTFITLEGYCVAREFPEYTKKPFNP